MKPTRIPDQWDARWFAGLWDEMKPLLDRLHVGSGDPENALTAPVGHLYLRVDGGANTTLYIKESGTGDTGWAAI